MTTSPKIPLNLCLVRHGQTEWSLLGQQTGSTDVPLTTKGERQSRRLITVPSGLHFDHVLTSPRQRARRTCELIGLGAPAQIEPDLGEWDYGDYEGLLTAGIHRTRPDWRVVHDGCPNGEQPADVSSRADRLIARLDRMSGNVALFSHGHFGASLAVRWIGLPVGAGLHFSLGTASLNILGYNPSHPKTGSSASGTRARIFSALAAMIHRLFRRQKVLSSVEWASAV